MLSSSCHCIKSLAMAQIPRKTAMIVLATGAEEIELVVPADILRRADVTVTVAGLTTDVPVQCSRDVSICPDYSFEESVKNGPFDAIILPGGLVGTRNLCSSAPLGELLKEQEAGGRIIAAICAAPLALKAHGVCVGKEITSYPTVREEMLDGGQYTYKECNVVCDGCLVTSRGPGTAFEFALTLVEMLVGKETRDTVAKALLLEK